MRITLGGGGTDLPSYYSKHGGFVRSMAVDKYFYTVINPRDDDKMQIISSDFKTIETRNREHINKFSLEIPKVVMNHFGIKRGCNIFMGSEIPSGTGLGSSGSVMVNLIKAISSFNKIELSSMIAGFGLKKTYRTLHTTGFITMDTAGNQHIGLLLIPIAWV